MLDNDEAKSVFQMKKTTIHLSCMIGSLLPTSARAWNCIGLVEFFITRLYLHYPHDGDTGNKFTVRVCEAAHCTKEISKCMLQCLQRLGIFPASFSSALHIQFVLNLHSVARLLGTPPRSQKWLAPIVSRTALLHLGQVAVVNNNLFSTGLTG